MLSIYDVIVFASLVVLGQEYIYRHMLYIFNNFIISKPSLCSLFELLLVIGHVSVTSYAMTIFVCLNCFCWESAQHSIPIILFLYLSYFNKNFPLFLRQTQQYRRIWLKRLRFFTQCRPVCLFCSLLVGFPAPQDAAAYLLCATLAVLVLHYAYYYSTEGFSLTGPLVKSMIDESIFGRITFTAHTIFFYVYLNILGEHDAVRKFNLLNLSDYVIISVHMASKYIICGFVISLYMGGSFFRAFVWHTILFSNQIYNIIFKVKHCVVIDIIDIGTIARAMHNRNWTTFNFLVGYSQLYIYASLALAAGIHDRLLVMNLSTLCYFPVYIYSIYYFKRHYDEYKFFIGVNNAQIILGSTLFTLMFGFSGKTFTALFSAIVFHMTTLSLQIENATVLYPTLPPGLLEFVSFFNNLGVNISRLHVPVVVKYDFTIIKYLLTKFGKWYFNNMFMYHWKCSIFVQCFFLQGDVNIMRSFLLREQTAISRIYSMESACWMSMNRFCAKLLYRYCNYASFLEVKMLYRIPLTVDIPMCIFRTAIILLVKYSNNINAKHELERFARHYTTVVPEPESFLHWQRFRFNLSYDEFDQNDFVSYYDGVLSLRSGRFPDLNLETPKSKVSTCCTTQSFVIQARVDKKDKPGYYKSNKPKVAEPTFAQRLGISEEYLQSFKRRNHSCRTDRREQRKYIDCTDLENVIYYLTNVSCRYICGPKELFFKGPIYKNIEIPSCLSSLVFEQVAELIGSLRNINMRDLFNEAYRLESAELDRTIEFVRKEWMENVVAQNCLRDYLVMHHAKYSSNFIKGVKSGRKADATFYFDNFDGVDVSKIKFSYDSIQDDFRGYITNSKDMSPQKIRSIVKTMVRDGKEYGEIMSVFKKRVVQFKADDLKVMRTNKKDDFLYIKVMRKYAWITDYITSDFEYVDYKDVANMNFFNKMISTFYDRLAAFVQNYLKLSILTPKEKESVLRDESKYIVQQMRLPENQFRFLAGESKQSITQSIKRKMGVRLRLETVKSDVFVEKQIKKKEKRERQISKARDTKTLMLNNVLFDNELDPDFESNFVPQSQFTFNSIPTEPEAKVYSFVDLLYQIFTFILNLFSRAFWYRTSVDYCLSTFRKRVALFIADPKKNPIPDFVKLRVIEIKALIHSLVSLYYGEFNSFWEHFSYFFITRPEELALAIKSIDLEYIRYMFSNQDPIITVGDRKLTLPKNYYDAFRDAYAKKDYPRAQYIIDNHAWDYVQPQFFDKAQEYLRTLMSVTSGDRFSHITSLEHMTYHDLSLANQQFAYVRNWKQANMDRISMIKTMTSFVCRMVLSFDPFDATHRHFFRQAVERMRYVDKLLLVENDLPKSKKDMFEVITQYEQHCIEVKDPRFAEMAGFLQRTYLSKMEKLTEIAARCSSMLKGTDKRPEPVFILFTGPPGVGKSTAMDFLMKAISKLEGTEYSPEMTYVFNGTSEYWEKYAQQDFVIMDDLFKEADTETRKIQACSLIGMINSIAMNLNVAAIVGKGVTFFVSRYVFASTNIANQGLNTCEFNVGLTDPNALKRRIHLSLHRVDPADGQVHEMTFKIEKCKNFPSFEGKILPLRLVAVLIARMRLDNERLFKEQEEATASQNLVVGTDEELDGVLVPQLEKDVAEEPMNMMEFTQAFDDITYAVDLKSKIWSSKWVIIGCSLIAISLACFGYILLKYMFPEVELQSWERNKRKKGYRQHNFMNAKRNLAPYKEKWSVYNPDRHVKPQSTEVNELTGLQRAAKCCVHIVAEYRNHSITQQAIHYADRRFITNCHFFACFEAPINEYKISIVIDSVAYPTKVTNTFHWTDEDAVMFQADNTVPLIASSAKYWCSASEIPRVKDGDILRLISIDRFGCTYLRSVTKALDEEYESYKAGETKITLHHPIRYVARTVSGDSGSIIAYIGPNSEVHFLGIHCGLKDGSLGVGMTLLREDLEQAKAYVEGSVVPQFLIERFPLKVDYTLPKGTGNVPMVKSQIKPSILNGYRGEPKYIPAFLKEFTNKDGIKIDPLLEGLKSFKQEEWRTELPKDEIMQYLQSVYPRRFDRKPVVLDRMQALRGDPQLGIPSMTMNTSAGYPFSKYGKKKLAICDFDPLTQTYTYKDYFIKCLDECMEKISKGERMDCLWTDTLKDETRPIEKVYKGKTRIFSCAPVSHTVLVRQYFQDFIMFVQGQCVLKPISIGINVHSADWTFLRQRLSAFAGSVLSGDFSKFDTNICRDIVEIVVDYINWWYNDGEQNALIRRMLMVEICEARHLLYDFVYTVYSSNPSGNGMTSIINSFVQLVMMYVVLVHDLKIPSSDFALAIYGDDGVVCIRREGITCNDLAPHFKRRFNADYTHFSKQEFNGVDTLDTISFLSRSWVYRNGVYQAPLDIDTIVESVYWVRDEAKEREVLLSTIQSFYIEASHHGPEVFYSLVRELREAIYERDLQLHNTLELPNMVHPWMYYFNSMYHPEMLKPLLPYVSSNKSDMKIKFVTQSKDSKFTLDEPYPESNQIQNNEVPDSSVEVVGVFHDIDGQESNTQRLISAPHSQFNVGPTEVEQSLEREYPLSTVSWTSDQSHGTHINYGSYKLPNSLLSVAPINVLSLSYARYFVSGIRVTFRVVASSFAYGSLVIAYIPPDDQIEPVIKSKNANARYTAYKHIMLSASNTDAVTMDVPFINGMRALDLTDVANMDMGKFVVMVWNPLRNITNESTTAEVYVTAQFIDPHVYVANGFTTQSLKEANMKAVNQSISAAFDVAEKTAAVVDCVSNFHSAVRASRKLLGYDKPQTMDRTKQVVLSPFSDMNSSIGVSHSVMLGNDQESHIAEAMTEVLEDQMSLKAIAGTPSVVRRSTITSTSDFIVSYLQSEDSQHFNYYDFVSKQFLYNAGSMKIMVMFHSNPNIRMRGIFYLSADANQEQSPYEFYHQVVDVVGDTTYKFRIPYLDQSFARKTGSLTYVLRFKVISLSSPYTATPAIYMTAYKASDKDMRFYVPRDIGFTPQCFVRKEFQVDEFEWFHPSFKYYYTKNLCNGEEYDHLRDVLMKDMPYQAYNNQPIVIDAYAPYGGLIGNVYNGIELWGLIFRYFRGSIRMRLLQRKFKGPLVCSLQHGSEPVPYFAMSTAENPQVSVCIPWNTDSAYARTYGTPYNYDLRVSGTAILEDEDYSNWKFLMKSVGDDFQFLYLGPPPPGDWNTPGAQTDNMVFFFGLSTEPAPPAV